MLHFKDQAFKNQAIFFRFHFCHRSDGFFFQRGPCWLFLFKVLEIPASWGRIWDRRRGHLSQLFQGRKGFLMGLLVYFFILGLKIFFLLLGHLLTDTDFHRQLAQTKAGQLLHQIGQVILAKMGRIHTLRAFDPKLPILIDHLQILKKGLETSTLTEFFLKSLTVIGLEDVAGQVLLVCH